MGLPILPHIRRQKPIRIVHYSGTASSLYLRQPRQSLKLGYREEGQEISGLVYYEFETAKKKAAKSTDKVGQP
jgi:hypothetical protein